MPILIIAASALSVSLLAAPALAQPPEPRGQGQGASQAQGQPGQGRQGQGHPGQGRSQAGERGPRAGDTAGGGEQGFHREHRQEHRQDRRGDWDRQRGEFRSGPRIDEREIRRLFRERRDWVEIDRRRDSLPPGIRMNLERGKPLPPGIAKRFDDRLYRELPRYDGYEWRRVGPDVVLVELANEIVYAVLRDLLY
ncbi:anti-virulence regulator CigR family protein [Billgrantia campisalis]|uniref:anti-virulence regulator CigR family protein n=1 Tax=Billgrantia campisalis TaxID=74661 RepID=UPI003BEEC26C